MTEVIRKRVWLELLLLFFSACAPARAQAPAPNPPSFAVPPAPKVSGPAEDLYLQLRRVGLNPTRTYKVRSATIDRPSFHITFEDGMIAFTNDVQGRVTGAFFEGDGEVLLAPPTREERAATALGTGMAILEERFNTAYIRFNDDSFGELQPFLRPSPDAQEFASRVNSAAQNLAELDALRVFVTLSRSLPVAGRGEPSAPPPPQPPDHFLHARVEGVELGAFDIHYDSLSYEQVAAGQSKDKDGVSYYDVWTSFSPGQPGALPSLQSAPPAEDSLQIDSYKINAMVTPPTDVTVDASLDVKVRSSGDRTVVFELSRFLQVKQVEMDGRPLEFINNQSLEGTQLARRGNDLVAVVFPQPLQAGDHFTLRFVYGGSVLSEAGGGLLYVGARGAWYPSRRLVFCDFDLTFRYPRGWTLIATGTRLAPAPPVTAAESSTSALLEERWKTERPIALAGFNLGKYVRASAQAGSVLVETFATRGVEKDFPHSTTALPPLPDIRGLGAIPEVEVQPSSPQPSPAKHAQAVASEAARSVEFFQERLGPFPYRSLSLTQIPGPVSQGWPGLIFLSSMSFLSPEEAEGLHFNSTRASLRRLALPHEIAHQWWGDLVIWRTYRDQWIVEALANYCALMKVQKDRPGEFRTVLEQYRKDLLAKNKNEEILRDAGPVTLGQRLANSHFPDGYEAVSYGRGTWLFHMLRYMLLDAQPHSDAKLDQPPIDAEPFTRILRNISERYAGQAIDTHELLSAFAENLPPALRFEGKQSLDWFEEGWVRGTAMPQFAVRNVRFTAKPGANIVSGVLLQKDAPSDLVTSVPLYAVVGRKNIFLARVLADGPETTFHLATPAGAHAILIDPNGTILTGEK